jgi:hypothetical protein
LLTVIAGETKRTETTVSILNLVPGTLYDIRVFTVSAPGFQTPSAVLHLRTAQCSKSDPQIDNSDGYPTIRAYSAKSNAAISPPTAPAMAREHSGGQPMGRRGTTGKNKSPANLVLESQAVSQYDDSQRSSDEEVAGTLAQLSERFQKVQQDNEITENQILEEEEEFEAALRELECQRDELKQKVKERDEQSSELRKQVHKLESESRAKQNERAKKERQLQQKENQHKRRRDEISTWDEQISTMEEEISFVEKQQAAIEERTASEIRNLRKKIEDEQREVRLLDEENQEKALQIKALEEERTRLNEDEETEESREADRVDRERDLLWQERQHNLGITYSNICHAHNQALKQFEIARERLTLCENIRRANASSAYAPPPPLDLEAIRKGMRPRRTRQRGSLASSVSSPMSNHPAIDSYSSNPSFHQQTTSASPTFSGPSFFNLKNGMTLITPAEEPVMTPEEADVLTGGAPMSPRADALLPANLLGDESTDDEAVNETTSPGQPAAAESKQMPFPSIGPSSLMGDAQGSPSPVSSSSQSFSSPRESLNNALDFDRRSLQSGRISVEQPDVVENPQSASRKLTTLFSFSRQRGKTLADGPPTLGSLKQGESQSFPRNFGDSVDSLAAQRRRRGYSGNWPFPMTNLLPRGSAGATGGKSSEPARLATTRGRFPNPFSGLGKSSVSTPAYDPFATRSDSFDASIGGGLRGDALSSRPSSIYSFDNLPRPSTESQFHAWGSHERSNLRGSPLAPDWSASQTWSRSQSRRPSLQYGSTSNLSLGAHIDEDFLEPPRETQRPLQAPIGTRPTSSQRPLTPKLNPAAPSFTTQFFARRADKNKEKAKLKAGEKGTPELGPEDASPPDSRKSRDTQSLATNGSTAESRESLERTASGQSGGMPVETTPSKETFIHKLITRKSSSSKFSSYKGLFPSKKGEPSTPGELDEDGITSDQQFGKSIESTSTTPITEKEERPRGNKSTLSWSFMGKRRKGPKEDLAASEVSESSERASEAGDDDIAEEVES